MRLGTWDQMIHLSSIRENKVGEFNLFPSNEDGEFIIIN